MMTVANSKISAINETAIAPGDAAESLTNKGQTFMRRVAWTVIAVPE
jgi:hypothetical protein